MKAMMKFLAKSSTAAPFTAGWLLPVLFALLSLDMLLSLAAFRLAIISAQLMHGVGWWVRIGGKGQARTVSSVSGRWGDYAKDGD